MADELRQARRAVAGGRNEEALVHLWNALEPVRLAGDASALEDVKRLAIEIARRGGPGERQEAERLLRALGAGARAEAGEPSVAVEWEAELEGPAGVEGAAEADVGPDDEFEPELAEPRASAEPDEGGEEAERPRRSLAARLLFPLLLLVIVLVNVLSRILDND